MHVVLQCTCTIQGHHVLVEGAEQGIVFMQRHQSAEPGRLPALQESIGEN